MRAVVALGLAMLVLVLGTIAVNPALHAALHAEQPHAHFESACPHHHDHGPDSGPAPATQGECVVCAFAQAHLLPVLPEPPLLHSPGPAVGDAFPADAVLRVQPDWDQPAGRGPPVT